MADDSGNHFFFAKWRTACDAEETSQLLSLLQGSGGGVEAEVEGLTSSESTAVFLAACRTGHADLLRKLLALEGDCAVDVHTGNDDGPEAGFRAACVHGHIDVVRELLALTGEREVDVHAGPVGEPEFGFLWACIKGHVDVVRELLALTGHRAVDVHAGVGGESDIAFRYAWERAQADVIRELLGLTGHRSIPLQARLEAGQAAVRLGKDAVWGGTSTRQGRHAMVLLRATLRARRQPRPHRRSARASPAGKASRSE